MNLEILDVSSRQQRDEERLFKMQANSQPNGMEKLETKSQQSEWQLHQLVTHLLQASEDERERISRQLHDDLGQALSYLKLRIGFLARQVPAEQASLQKEFEETLAYLAGTIESTRKLSHELSPSILADLGLGTALKRLITGFEKLGQCKVSSRIGGVDRLLRKDAEINLYRILQEALKNIESHAGAQNVIIIVERLGDRIFFLVEDDGKGFDRKTVSVAADQGAGIAIMRERARMMDGDMDLQSQTGKGTRISISIPLMETRNEHGLLSPGSCR